MLITLKIRKTIAVFLLCCCGTLLAQQNRSETEMLVSEMLTGIEVMANSRQEAASLEKIAGSIYKITNLADDLKIDRLLANRILEPSRIRNFIELMATEDPLAQYELLRVREALCSLIGSLTPKAPASNPETILAYHALAKMILLVTEDINKLNHARTAQVAKLTELEDETQVRLLLAMQAARRKMYERLADLLYSCEASFNDEQRCCFLFLIGYTNIQIKELEDELKKKAVPTLQK